MMNDEERVLHHDSDDVAIMLKMCRQPLEPFSIIRSSTGVQISSLKVLVKPVCTYDCVLHS